MAAFILGIIAFSFIYYYGVIWEGETIVWIIIAIIVFISYNGKKRISMETMKDSTLEHVKYVRVNYVNIKNEVFSQIYETSAHYASNHYRFFIDSMLWVDDTLAKQSVVFLDANKNEISMKNYSYSFDDNKQYKDCGFIDVYKR